jgi:fibronectin type 3 domain-containing protein
MCCRSKRIAATLFGVCSLVAIGAGGAQRAHADGFISAASRTDEVYDSKRDIVYVANGNQIVQYQVGTNTYLTPISLPGSTLTGIDISPDDNTLAVANSTLDASANPMIYLIDLRTQTINTVDFPHASMEGGTWSVAFTDDGGLLVTTRFNGSGWVPFRRYNLATGQTTIISQSLDQDSMLCPSADRSTIGVAESNSSDGPFGRYRAADKNWLQQTGYTYGTSWYNYEIGANPTGTQFAIPTYGGTFFYDANLLRTGSTVGVYASGQPIGVVYSPNSNVVYFPWVGTSTVYVYDTTTFNSIASYNFGSAFQNNGNHAYVSGRMKVAKNGSLLFGSVSGGVQFVTVNNNPVRLDAIGPQTTPAGSPDTTITVNGAGFTANSVVQWNGTALVTTLVSATQLQALVPAANLASSGYGEITVADSGNLTNPLRFYIPPTAPSGLTAQPALSKVTLNWTAGSGTASYNVYRSTTAGGEGTTPYATGVTSTTYIDTNVTNGTTYFYTVVADNAGGLSAPTNEASATPSYPPSTPTNVTATGGMSTIALSWVSSSTWNKSFNVYRGTTSGSETLYQSGITATSYTDSNVTFGQTYFYKVSAVNQVGESALSSEVSAALTGLVRPTTTASMAGTAGNSPWYLTNVTVTLTANAGSFPVTATYYTVDGGAQQTYSAPFVVSGDGVHKLTYWSVDQNNNAEAVNTSSISIDTTAPVVTFGTASPSANAAGWNNGQVSVPFTVSDATSGVGSSSPASPLTFTAEGAGQTATVTVTDAAGNTATVKSPAVNIDLTAPYTYISMTGTYSGTSGVSLSPVTVTLTGNDALSGVAATYYTVDGGAQQTYSAAFTVSGDGSHTVKYWTVDAAGNVEAAHTQTISIDTSVPVTTATLSGPTGSNGWYKGSVNVTLSATEPDGSSEIQTTWYTLDNATSTYSAPFTISGDGTHALSYRSQDTAGNLENWSAPQSVNIDSTAPVSTASVSGATVTISASDATSGVAATDYTIDGGAQQTYTSPFTVAGAGGHTVAYWSVDKAGNAEAQHTTTVTVNPSPSLTSVSPSTITAGTSATITLTGSGFISSSVVYANSTALATTYVSGTSLTAVIPTSLTSSTGTLSITVVNPAPGGGGSNAVAISVVPVTLASVSVSPTSVKGGASAAGTVTLTGPAPSGLTVTLKSSNSKVTISPTSLTIGAGGTSGSFKVNTTHVSSTTAVTITATLGTTSKTTTLTVTK